MTDSLDIADVARLTGLTPRALRFYEARGLVAPLRAAGGRRVFRAADIARLHQLIALKHAGLSLADIGRLISHQPVDLKRLLEAQLALIEERAARLQAARALVTATLSRIDRGEPIDAETFCSLIQHGDMIMKTETEQWRAVTDRYFSPEEKARWTESMAKVPAGFSQEEYAVQWRDLGARIKAALPLDPASAPAQTLLAEWLALLRPFAAAASPEMMRGATALYDRLGEWQGDADPGFDATVWAFIKAAGAAKAGGHSRS